MCLEARAERLTQWKTCVHNSYPLVREHLQELFGVRGSQQVEETAADSLVFLYLSFSHFWVGLYHRSLAPCVLDHGVLVSLAKPSPLAFQLALCTDCISHPCTPPYFHTGLLFSPIEQTHPSDCIQQRRTHWAQHISSCTTCYHTISHILIFIVPTSSPSLPCITFRILLQHRGSRRKQQIL